MPQIGYNLILQVW